jgi:hypothetical protein
MYAILRIAKLKTTGNIGGLNTHLTRTMNVPNADPELTKYNSILVGSNNLNSDVNNRIVQAGITPRKNAVLAIEHLITTSPEFFVAMSKTKNEKGESILNADQKTIENLNEFKKRAIDWLNKRYETVNVVNVTLHMDEKTPHIHAIVVPIDEKGKLNARGIVGNREKMRGMQDSFAKEMEPLGLRRGIQGSKAKHVTVKEFYSQLNNQVSESREKYVLAEPPILGIGKDKWREQENEKINKAIQEKEHRSNFQDMERFYQKRKYDNNNREADQLRDEKSALYKEIHTLRDKLSAMENLVNNLRAIAEKIQNEIMNYGFRMDMDRLRLVKMTDQEREQHKINQEIKTAKELEELKRQQEQERDRGRGRGMSM